eukprot:NODE_5026_length_536_cov_294.726899_g3698_i0.p1 GENE.NODE_5026_length_536_cov_294.726899_g3698_i0~~NODE_5026_length_536_cov_294.726899_g3698_i0.p1  ORF type:complete len:167 (-),score=12.64 NODE_5026_length_536_cov_294.726899_g3698_i0:34-513(-)
MGDSYDGNKKVDSEEFFVGLNELHCDLTKEETQQLLQLLDTDGDGHINLDEFLVGIRGQLNDKRQAMVDKAFLKFDNDGSGQIGVADLRGVYDCSLHPKFQDGTMTEEQIFMEFLESFGDKNSDGIINRQEWNDYYSAVSSNIDNDDHFVELMQTAWKL